MNEQARRIAAEKNISTRLAAQFNVLAARVSSLNDKQWLALSAEEKSKLSLIETILTNMAKAREGAR